MDFLFSIAFMLLYIVLRITTLHVCVYYIVHAINADIFSVLSALILKSEVKKLKEFKIIIKFMYWWKFFYAIVKTKVIVNKKSMHKCL